MSLTDLNRAGHRVLRLVSGAFRFVLPIAIGVALLLSCTRFVLGADPAVRTGGRIPSGYMQVDADGWTMTVPASWENVPVFKPDSPSTVMHLMASSKPIPTSIPERFPEYRVGDADLSLLVSRQSRDWIDLDGVVNDTCFRFRCAPDLRKERRPVDVRGRPGVLTDVDRADGSREWVLVVQNDCYIYSAHARLAAGRVADMSAAVERVLASAALKDSWKLFGYCAWGKAGSYHHRSSLSPVPGRGGAPTGSQGPSARAH
jgi:hypothetical protein